MMFKKKNLLSKLWLKFTDKPAYKKYKWEMINYRQTQFTDHLIGDNKLNNVNKILDAAKANKSLNLIHSGNAGDIIYALATIKKIGEITNVPVNLCLKIGRPNHSPFYSSHPVGNVMLNQGMVNNLIPLIQSQPYINNCEVYTDQPIHIDLDYFRSGTVPLNGNIARWYSYITGVSPVLWKPWLTIDADKSYADTIVMARSGRYQNRAIDYSFLNAYPKVVFIGIESEYKDLLPVIPNLQWKPVTDFLELAQVVAGCRLFIGNQSFPFSVAEALKVPRILEVSYEIINVVPEGEGSHDFFYQEHLEYLVKELTNEAISGLLPVK
ncbi:hypothetical protein [Mucilaginibacter phyllosphaerae]|uniref:Uncharacterized protein n=1 Tax=Mucilaginibacter phyllosphaerae TaxID=1812349 RepID=A0A4Y8AGH9_9SPHI|nr:hypothetical protein [Mucilaginibacter phyllosphaerae]MBB3969032.1 hypothetical protein [Mucilaginibacter phyllosphaerae]TEW67355.1 hypothetical protein E2R65_05020 [Mucilaginibacter phyllosphaerae]GGH23675.1 hypothetical protein GCM10007352_37680 [Mucilaginibacter phyllosphaerae]